MDLKPLSTKPLPPALSLAKLIGPSFIILGVGLGSGELILWPYLSSNFGLGIIWGAILGITFQFFINMEIERYTLVRGESIFVGLARKFGVLAPIWFTISTFIPWMWPGIIASSAKLLTNAAGMEYSPLSGIILLAILGLIFSLGSVVYKTQENVQKAIILVSIPFVLGLTFIFTKASHLEALFAGFIGKGEGYWFLPVGLPVGTFLTAFAYAGAGGNLNLAQSLYIKEKGYGMAAYAGRLTNIIFGRQEKLILEGSKFEINKENVGKFRSWWRRMNLEHGLVFWLTGASTMVLLSLLAYATVHGNPNVSTSINFVIEEAKVISSKISPALGTSFLVMAALMLFGTQFSVYGSNARIMSENLIVTKKFKVEKAPSYFYLLLWLQILAGVIIFALGLKEPLSLLVIGGFLNAISMFVYSGLVLWLNLTSLEKPLRPSLIRVLFVVAGFIFYGVFSFLTITKAV